MNQEINVAEFLVEKVKQYSLRVCYGHNNQVNLPKGTELPIINGEWLIFIENDENRVHYIKIDSIYDISYIDNNV